MFDPSTKSHVHLSDQIWPFTDMNTVSFSLKDYSNRPPKTPSNHPGNRRNQNSINTRAEEQHDGDDVDNHDNDDADDDDDDSSGVSTPPLWRSSSPPSSPPPPPHHHHQQHRHRYRSLSPTSKTQAIARGQRELMEMVSKMPESCYELSLKDLVEQPMVIAEAKEREENDMQVMEEEKKKKKLKKTKLNRTGSLGSNYASNNGSNNGFLLKMSFPVTFGSTIGTTTTSKKKTKNRDSLARSDSTVSPRISSVSEGSVKEWWKKEKDRSSSNSGSSTSNGSGSRSSSSSRSSSRRYPNSNTCWSFLF